MNQSVTVSFVPQQLLTWVIIGLIAGLVAGFVYSRARAWICFEYCGRSAGRFVRWLSRFGLRADPTAIHALNGGITLAWADIVVAFVGAVIVLLLFGGFYHRRGSTGGAPSKLIFLPLNWSR